MTHVVHSEARAQESATDHEKDEVLTLANDSFLDFIVNAIQPTYIFFWIFINFYEIFDGLCGKKVKQNCVGKEIENIS